MSLLLAVLLLATDSAKEDAKITVDSVTVNGEPTTTSKASGAASTASNPGQQWSIVSARTVGAGANMVQGGLGFPGIYVQFLHGMTPVLDLGLRAAFNYGVEGQVSCNVIVCPAGALAPGLRLQGVARYKLYDNGKINAGASFAPGLVYFHDRFFGSQLGFVLPIAGTLGIVVSSAMNVSVTLEMPLWIKFGRSSGVAVPFLAGAGFEYFISSALAVFFELRMGPTLWGGNNAPAAFTFYGNLGAGWRF